MQGPGAAVGPGEDDPGHGEAGHDEPGDGTPIHGMARPAPREWGTDEERALRVWVTLARCYLSVSQAVGERVADYGLTRPQFGVLEALHHLGPLSLGELADKLLVTGGNITYVMDRLEAAGLVARKRSKKDRRVILAHLTEEGTSLVNQVFPAHANYLRELLEPLDASEQEQLRTLLKRLGTSV
ncbi:MAG: MarR family transcriptional regulator [Gemmatimonadota bacterium]